MELGEIINLAVTIIGIFGGGTLLYHRQTRIAKELENRSTEISNESKSNDEWIRLYREMKDEVKEQRDAKIELRDEISKLKVQLTELKGWRCLRTNCVKREPPSAVTMTQDHTND